MKSAPTTKFEIRAREDEYEALGDMACYDSGGSAAAQRGSSGVRLLAVKPGARGAGVGKALTQACIGRARKKGSAQVNLHSTKSRQIAWGDVRTHGVSKIA